MLKIERHENERMTIEDFKKRKKKSPYKSMRRNAKFNNFGFLFGQVAFSFGMGTLKDNWEETDCDNFIRDQDLEGALEEILKDPNNKLSLLDAKYIVCSKVLRDVWFDTYPTVWQWICGNSNFAIKHGYVRSPFGARRLLPEMTVNTPDGAGDDMNQRHIKNMKNIASNSPVQNHEVVFMNRAQRIIFDYIKAHGLKTKIIGNVHDATVKYLHKAETSELLPVIHRAFSMDYPENNNIPYEGETNLADPVKNEYWGFGPIEIGKEEALKNEKVEISELAAKAKAEFEEKDEYVDLEDFEDYDEGDEY